MHASQTTTNSQGTGQVPKQVRKRRTPEERAREEAIRKASRARQKQLAAFTSAKCALQHISVILDVRLMETETGLAIGSECTSGLLFCRSVSCTKSAFQLLRLQVN